MIAVVRKYDSEYEFSVERITISIDKKTLKRIKALAGARGVSRFLTVAARERLGRMGWQELMVEMEDRWGKPTQPELDEVDRDMRKAFGMAPPTKPWRPRRDGVR